jgi:hypothetical protein
MRTAPFSGSWTGASPHGVTRGQWYFPRALRNTDGLSQRELSAPKSARERVSFAVTGFVDGEPAGRHDGTDSRDRLAQPGEGGEGLDRRAIGKLCRFVSSRACSTSRNVDGASLVWFVRRAAKVGLAHSDTVIGVVLVTRSAATDDEATR